MYRFFIGFPGSKIRNSSETETGSKHLLPVIYLTGDELSSNLLHQTNPFCNEKTDPNAFCGNDTCHRLPAART
jgi:hypothetical protein